MNIVRSCISLSIAFWINASLLTSRAEVASSKTISGGFFRNTRAIAMRCFCPPERVVAADVGFVFKNRIVYGERSGGLYIVRGEHMQKLTFPDVEYFYRVSYNPDNPSEWLISGQTKSGGIFSRICNVFAGTLQSLCVNGEPAYKAALFSGKCFYAERGENGFEDRRIVEAAEFTRIDLEFDKSAIL